MIRKYLWQFITLLLALGTIYATYDVFIRGKPVKELQISIESAVSLVDIRPEASTLRRKWVVSRRS
jgi:hypothetical protein